MADGDYNNILIFSFTFIGDAVLSTCVISPLRRTCPQASLTFLVGSAARPLLDGDPQIDRVLVYDNRGEHRGVFGKRRLIQQLRDETFDLVIDLRDSLWSWFAGGERWGIKCREYRTHAVTRYLSALDRINVKGAAPSIVLKDCEIRNAEQRIGPKNTRYRIAVHPGGNWVYKRWPVAHFARLADRLVVSLNAEIVLVGGPGENEIIEDVIGQMKFSPLMLNGISLREVAAVISLCDHYIGNDTGPMHLAAAVGTPVTAIFASTDHRRSGPYGDQHRVVLSEKNPGCQPCHPGRHPGKCSRGFCEILNSISIDEVFETVCAQISVL